MTQDTALQILKSGKTVFLTGEPGAGKTHTVNKFIEWMRGQGILYAVTASTGIAATHINGTTVHSWSGLGISKKVSDTLLNKIYNDEYAMRRICSPRVLVIDEVSMLEATFIDNLDELLRAVRGSASTPFGGMQVVFVGDFFQLPPVVREGKARFAFESAAWKEANPTVCYLTEQHRQSDPVFLDILTAFRSGDVTDKHKKLLLSCVKEEVPETCLFTHNLDVDRINEKELAKLEGKEFTFSMKEEGIPFLVARLKEHCLAPAELKLKIGATVMFVRNNFEAGYVNGTIGKVIRIAFNGLPEVETKEGRRLVPEIAEWKFEEHGRVKASIRQAPLRLAYAITVHKSQGMSLDSAAIDLTRTFEYGQGYVAISRVRSLEGLHLEGINAKAFEMHPLVTEQDKVFRSLGT